MEFDICTKLQSSLGGSVKWKGFHGKPFNQIAAS